jgi:GGDEF domain-containing protein
VETNLTLNQMLVLVIIGAATIASALAAFEVSAFAAPAAVALCTAVALFPRQRRAIIDAAVAPADFLSKQVEQGRRMAIFDLETGLLAEWYVMGRISEECARAKRHGSSFAVALLQVDRAAITLAGEDALLEWMRSRRRTTDLAGYVGGGRYLLLLPHTDGDQAEVVLRRAQEVCPVKGAVAIYQRDGASVDELRQRVEERLARTDRTKQAHSRELAA